MRCYSCNRNLSDAESVMKSAKTGEYLDMCRKCVKDVDIEVLENNNELNTIPPEDEYYYEMDDVEFHSFEVNEDD